MSKLLILCRHGKSDYPDDAKDFDRTLTQRGLDDSKLIGRLFKKMAIVPGCVLASPAIRASVTSITMMQELGFTDQIQWEKSLYEEGLENALKLTSNISNEFNTAMIIGHNPTMEEIAHTFLNMKSVINIPTCGIVAIEFYVEDWQSINSTNAILKWFIRPKLIRD
ncbi:MAG: histidine phosphatase family protein [Bacteroidia bacterium]|nr:histidine phosphatase family protein [Bacteroidia bacterium]